MELDCAALMTAQVGVLRQIRRLISEVRPYNTAAAASMPLAGHGQSVPLSIPLTSRSMDTRNTLQIRSSVVTVMGRPASICCQ